MQLGEKQKWQMQKNKCKWKMQVWEKKKWQLQKKGIEECKFQKGETNNCKTNELNNVGLREDTVANEDNLERGTGDKWRTVEKKQGQVGRKHT